MVSLPHWFVSLHLHAPLVWTWPVVSMFVGVKSTYTLRRHATWELFRQLVDSKVDRICPRLGWSSKHFKGDSKPYLAG